MIYTAKLKTRKEMERTIRRELLGWWHDVCPGQTLELRDATHEDLARCNLKEASSRDPADYLCENVERGSLVLREAIAVLTPWTDEQMDGEVQKAIERLGAERFARILGMQELRAIVGAEALGHARWEKWLKADHIKLHAGEMTAQELRTVQAVVRAMLAEAARGAKTSQALVDERIEALAVKHEAFGFGRVDERGLTTHGFDPEGLRAFARELLGASGANESCGVTDKAPPSGAMFDAFGRQRKRYVRITLDGSHLILSPKELEAWKTDEPNPDRFTYADVYLSPEEADALPEFDGF